VVKKIINQSKQAQNLSNHLLSL